MDAAVVRVVEVGGKRVDPEGGRMRASAGEERSVGLVGERANGVLGCADEGDGADLVEREETVQVRRGRDALLVEASKSWSALASSIN